MCNTLFFKTIQHYTTRVHYATSDQARVHCNFVFLLLLLFMV